MAQPKRLPVLIAALSTVALASCGNAAETKAQANASVNGSIPQAQKLAGSPNESWINLTGSVVSASPDSFTLNYGPRQRHGRGRRLGLV